jgi:hypothetical protein
MRHISPISNGQDNDHNQERHLQPQSDHGSRPLHGPLAREGNGKTYRERFADALRYEWKKAKDAHGRLECALGLPIRSCFADVPARRPAGIFAGVRPARRLFTTHSGRLAGSFAA